MVWRLLDPGRVLKPHTHISNESCARTTLKVRLSVNKIRLENPSCYFNRGDYSQNYVSGRDQGPLMAISYLRVLQMQKLDQNQNNFGN